MAFTASAEYEKNVMYLGIVRLPLFFNARLNLPEHRTA